LIPIIVYFNCIQIAEKRRCRYLIAPWKIGADRVVEAGLDV
jgi:hypothetical protein